jgi:SnoaL-like polyketide cyclase
MNRILDRRSALKMGMLTTMGLGALSRYAEASTDLQSKNKAVVGRWFTEFWGKTYNPAVVDELASTEMFLRYSLHRSRHGREDIKAFMHGFREAFPDLSFLGTAPLLADGDHVIGQWEVAARIQDRPLVTSWQGRCWLRRVARCTSPERQCCVLRTARSSKRSDSTMVSPHSLSSVLCALSNS